MVSVFRVYVCVNNSHWLHQGIASLRCFRPRRRYPPPPTCRKPSSIRSTARTPAAEYLLSVAKGELGAGDAAATAPATAQREALVRGKDR